MTRPEDIEAFVDERLEGMRKHAPMWGPPIAVECTCHLLLEMYELFGKEGPPYETGPSRANYQKFRRTMHPKCPGPMTLAQWFTDAKWGCATGVDPEADEMAAGQKIVEFFIAWKKHLKQGGDHVLAEARTPTR